MSKYIYVTGTHNNYFPYAMQKQKIRVQCRETVSRRTSALMGANRGDTEQTTVGPFPGEVALSEGKTPVSSGHSSPGVVNLSSRHISSQFLRGNCNKLCLRLSALKQALSQNIATKTSSVSEYRH